MGWYSVASSCLLLSVVVEGAKLKKGENKAVLGHLSPNIVYYNKQINQVFPKDYEVHPPFDDTWKSNDASIVVLIAALRESRLPNTLVEMFAKAKYPERIFAAVVQQNAPGDEDAVEAFCAQVGGGCPYRDHVRMIRMDAQDAKGPVFARARQAELVTTQDDFCMQIDAHTEFIQDWDLNMLHDWGSTNNEYAVMTTYPSNIKDLGQNVGGQWNMPILCGATIGGSGVVVNHQASACANQEQPIQGPLWAAGLSFMRCHAELNVPNDINLKGVFAGEEFARGARLWTHGYDFYTLTKPFIATYYGGEKGGKGSFSATSEEHAVSRRRMGTLLKAKGSDQSEAAYAELGNYTLGTRRTLEQYIEFSGINTITGKASPTCVHPHIPWNDDSLYSEYKAGAHDHTEEVSDHVIPAETGNGPEAGASQGYTGASARRTFYVWEGLLALVASLGLFVALLSMCGQKQMANPKNSV